MLEQFKKPPAHYRLMPLWFWNAMPNPEEVERQINEMHTHGIGGFYVVECADARAKSDPEIWQECIQRAGSVAAELGMSATVCSANGADTSTEHPNSPTANSTVKGQVPLMGEVVQIPGSDGTASPALMICADWPRRAAGPDGLAEKLGVSTAHCAGLERVLTTPFVVPEWGRTLNRMKAAVDKAVALGVNAFCPYGFPYSITPASDGIPPASIFYQSALWPKFKRFADYAARLSFALSQGKHKAQIALLNPAKGFAYECQKDPQSPVTRLIAGYFNVYCEQLLQAHIDYDIICEESLARALAVDQRLVIEGEEYDALIMPATTAMSLAAAEKIAEHVEDGGPLLANTLLPLYDADGERHSELRHLFQTIFGRDPEDLREQAMEGSLERSPRLSHNFGNLLFYEASDPAELVSGMRETVSMAIKPEVSIRRKGSECGNIIYQHRIVGERDLFFFTNTCPEPQEVRISVRCDKAPFVLDPETGESIALTNCSLKGSRTVFARRFNGYESLLVMFADELALPAIPRSTRDGYEIVLSNEWEFVADERNCLPLRQWTSGTHPDNSELCEHKTDFLIEKLPDELLLVVERECRQDPHQIVVNGHPAKAGRGWAIDVGYEAMDITAIAKSGKNELLMTTCADSGNAPFARLMGFFSLDRSRSAICPPATSMCTGSWTNQGYPYYSGTGVYSQAVEIPAFHSNQRVVLRTERPADMVEFIANGVSGGVRLWAPYEVDITHLVRTGRNRIQLRITNTSANALAAEEQPSGLLGGVRLIIY